MVGPGCPVCVSAPFQGAMQPHNADLHQRTYAREGGAPSLGPAWRHSESSPCRPDPDLPSGTVGLISSALCSRQPYLPPGWPMGEVLIRFLTDDPALGVAPLSNHVLFVLSHTSSAATCSVHTRPTPAAAAFYTGLRKCHTRLFWELRDARSPSVSKSPSGWLAARGAFRVLRPARVVPESPNPGWGPPLRPCVHSIAILGAISAARLVPECSLLSTGGLKLIHSIQHWRRRRMGTWPFRGRFFRDPNRY